MSWFNDFAARQVGGFDPNRLQNADLTEELEELVETALGSENSLESPQALSSLFGDAGFDSGLGASVGDAVSAPPTSPFGAAAGFIDGIVGPAYIPGPHLDGADNDSRMPPVAQGNSNACGSSSLAMIMNYL